MIIKNGIICDKEQEFRGDIRVESGVITKVAESITPYNGEEIKDVGGKYVMPAIVDLNITVKNQALTTKSLQEISNLAIKSGVSTVAINPNVTPKIDNESVVDLIQTKLKYNKNIINMLPIASSVSNGKLNNISILIKAGCKAIGFQSKHNSAIALKVLEYASLLNVPVLVNAMDISLKGQGVMNDGEVSAKLGLSGISEISEYADVAKLVKIASAVDAKVVFKNISSPKSIEIINRAKGDGLDIKSEVSIHHLILDESACDNYNTYAKIEPPLRSVHSVKDLREKLKNGEIDLLTSLQSDVSNTKKDLAFDDAMNGISALKYYFALAYTNFVKTELISLKKLSQMISYEPSMIIGLTKQGLIKEGFKAKLMVVDTEIKTTISGVSPYAGMEVQGGVELLKL